MLALQDRIKTLFWNNSFWLPANYSWEDLQNHNNGAFSHIHHAEVGDLLVVFPMAVFLSVIRVFVEKFIFRPIGLLYKLRCGRIPHLEPVDFLHAYYKKVKRPSPEEMDNLANCLGWCRRKVERWFRKRRNVDKSSEMKKFCESGWRFTFYATLHIYGCYVLHDENFIFDTSSTYLNWPHLHVKSEFFWYYMTELSFYLALMFSLITDVKRKDFIAMVVHHIVTILLMSYSWAVNLVPCGLIVLFTHDIIDCWMEAAKMAKYLRYGKLCDALFIAFTVLWTLTRVVYFPFIVLFNFWFLGLRALYCWGVICTNICLTILQILHILWTKEIYLMVYRSVKTKTCQDARSCSEVSSLSDDDEKGEKINRQKWE